MLEITAIKGLLCEKAITSHGHYSHLYLWVNFESGGNCAGGEKSMKTCELEMTGSEGVRILHMCVCVFENGTHAYTLQ